jgi:hypothetical protein
MADIRMQFSAFTIAASQKQAFSTTRNSMTIFRGMPRILAIAGLAMGIAGCGGGSDSGSASATANAAISPQTAEGLWTGTLRTSNTSQVQSVVILALPTGETRLVANDCLQVIAFTQSTGQFVSGNGNAYTPDGGLSSCPVGFKFPDGSVLAAASIGGQIVPHQSLTGTFSAGGSTSTFATTYNAAYDRSGELSRLAGTYGNGTATIRIDAKGNISGSLGSYFVSGTASVISPTKNAWYINIQEYTLSSTSTASGVVTTPVNGPKWGGAATLIDSPDKTDGELVVSLGNPDSGFGAILMRQ